MGGVYGPLLASHACTKLGSKAWEFATPLLLLKFSANGSDLMAPTVFGLATYVFKFLFDHVYCASDAHFFCQI